MASKTINVTCEGADKIPLEQLKEFQGKLKKLSEENYERLKRSILQHGFSFPVFVWKDKKTNWVLDAHQRINVLTRMKDDGFKIPALPVVWIEAKNKKEAAKKLLSLNSRYGEITDEGLAEYIQNFDLDLGQINVDFTFPEVDIFSMGKKFFPETYEVAFEALRKGKTGVDEDEVPEPPKEVYVKKGEVWLLGNHRLMCGDSTSIGAVKKLMNGEKTDMVFTDPPYGMNFQSNFREKTPQFKKLKNDDKILEVGSVIYEAMNENSAAYICCRWDLYDQWLVQFKDIFSIKNLVVWHKPGGGMGDLKNAYSPNHEFIIVAHKGASYLREKRESDVWTIGKDGSGEYQHPTQKPVALSEFAIGNHSDAKQNVLDLFGGSGSTLIACEKTNRKCFMMELDPHYCQVIIDRWEKYTGLKAMREDGANIEKLRKFKTKGSKQSEGVDKA